MIMKLEKPNILHKEKYLDLIAKWSKEEDISQTSPGALFQWENFEKFLEIINNQRVNFPGEKVPAQLYFGIVWNEIVWAIDIRFHINNEFLLQYGWHIWYGISPLYRRKWYATKMLWLALEECKKLNISKALVTCYTDNIASAKTIEKNWGKLENIIDWNGRENSRYWIDIK